MTVTYIHVAYRVTSVYINVTYLSSNWIPFSMMKGVSLNFVFLNQCYRFDTVAWFARCSALPMACTRSWTSRGTWSTRWSMQRGRSCLQSAAYLAPSAHPSLQPRLELPCERWKVSRRPKQGFCGYVLCSGSFYMQSKTLFWRGPTFWTGVAFDYIDTLRLL